MKPQRKNVGGRKSEQHCYHPQPKPSSVQSAVWCVHQESVSTDTNEHARIDHQPLQKFSSARNEPCNNGTNSKRTLLKLLKYPKFTGAVCSLVQRLPNGEVLLMRK